MEDQKPTKWRINSTDGTARFKLPEPGEVLMVHSDGEFFWVTWPREGEREEVQFEAEDDDESCSCGRPGCPGHVDPPPHPTCIAAVGRDQLTAIVLSLADVEKIKEAAYRAGREDAARELTVDRQWFPIDAKVDVVFADGSHRYWSTHCRCLGNHDACSATVIEGMDVHEDMLAYVARKPAQCRSCSSPCLCTCHKDQRVGDGVQPTEEQRSGNEDQKRDEEE
jgi:hypothetical protein